MLKSKPKTASRGYFRNRKPVESDAYKPDSVDVDTAKIAWTAQSNFSVAAKCGDLIEFVNRNMFTPSSPFSSLYRALLRGLPTHSPELVVHFDVVRAGKHPLQAVTFIEVEARELNCKFILPNSFTGACRPIFVH